MEKVIIFQDRIDDKHQDCAWYGGDIAAMQDDNYALLLCAVGDVRATLWETAKQDKVLVHVVDKNMSGRFYDEMRDYIGSDEELIELEKEGRLTFENNNWFEILVRNKKTDMMDGFVVETVWKYDEVLKEFTENYQEYIEWLDNEYNG